MLKMQTQDCLSVEGGPPTNVCIYLRSFDFCCYDLGPMTLMSEIDLGILRMYTKNEVSRSKPSKIRTQTEQTATNEHAHGNKAATEHHLSVTGAANISVLYLIVLSCWHFIQVIG